MKKFGLVVFAVVFSLFVSSSSSFSSATEEMEGTLEVIMATKVGQKTCEPLYFINIGGKKTQFSLPATAPPNLKPGQKIKNSGRWEESAGKKGFHCRKVEAIAIAPVAKKATSSADGVSSYLPAQTPVLDEQKTLMILLHFPDHKTPRWGKNEAEKKVFSSEPTDEYPSDHSDNAFLKACSNEKTWLDGECLDGWKDMSYPSTDYGYGSDSELDFFDEIRTEAINATDPYVNYKEYDSVLFVRTGNGWRYDFSTLGKQIIETADGEVSLSLSFVTHGDIVLDNGDIALDNGYVAHELIIHGILGLIHANSIDISNGEIFSYGDQWDNRGAQYALIDGLHKYMTGLLGTDQIQIVESSGEYSLDQRELESGGIKLLVIFLGYDGDGEPILYYLEYFKELGEFDSQVFDDSDSDINKNTVLLRKYKREYPYDSVVYVPDSFGREPVDLESQEFCDSDYENLEHYGVCVQVLEKIGTEEESKAKVKITLTEDYNKPSPTPTPPPPCIYSISPASYSHGAGSETGSIEVTASSGSCGWTAVSNAEDWIVITSGSSGAGNGTVYYLVSANTGVAPRTGTMTIAEQTFTVNQDQPPPPPCEAETISVSANSPLKLVKKTSGDVTITITGADGCAVEGESVTATINKAGKKRVKVSPSSAETDENGQAVFTITAKKKTGKAKISFQAGSLESVLTVKVKKK